MKSQWMRKKQLHIALLVLMPFAAYGLLLLAKYCYAAWVMPFLPPCIFRTLTGYKCPGCGMTHAVFALCRGDFLTVLKENAVLIFAVLLLLLFYIELWMAALGRPKKIIPRSRKFWFSALGMWLVYSVLRNLF